MISYLAIWTHFLKIKHGRGIFLRMLACRGSFVYCPSPVIKETRKQVMSHFHSDRWDNEWKCDACQELLPSRLYQLVIRVNNEWLESSGKWWQYETIFDTSGGALPLLEFPAFPVEFWPDNKQQFSTLSNPSQEVSPTASFCRCSHPIIYP